MKSKENGDTRKTNSHNFARAERSELRPPPGTTPLDPPHASFTLDTKKSVA
jgi:hypothetical protein